MRVLGIDYGTKRIGVAIADTAVPVAVPRGTIAGGSRAIDAIATLVAEEGIERIVVGLPLTLRGEHGPMAEIAEAFGKKLREKTGIPVVFLDERLTTRAIPTRGVVSPDAAAATAILQLWLDRQREQPPSASDAPGSHPSPQDPRMLVRDRTETREREKRYNTAMGGDHPFLSVIIPAYNEERRIGSTLDAIASYLQRKPFPSEVLVVSDGSTDRTAAVVEEHRRSMPNLQLIANPENHGKGYVVRQGMLAARGALRLFTDADNATPIEELEQLLPFVKQPNGVGEYDVVIGSIGLPGSRVEKAEGGLRSFAGKLANLLIRATVLPGIHDTQRGFKLFTEEAAKAVFSRTTVDRWGFDIEALALARKLNFRIREVPIRWIHNPESKVKPSAYLTTLLELLRIRLRLTLGAYEVRRKK